MHIGSRWIRRSSELTLKSFVKFSRFVLDISIKTLLNLLQKKNWLHLSRNLVTLASVICYLQSIPIKCTSLGEHLLRSSIGASLGRQHDLIDSGNHELKSCRQYGALIPDDIINQDIKDSKAYKTYYDFAIGKATLKKARKYKKVASPSRKLSPVLEEEPAEKPKRDKKPAKKSTTVPTTGISIRDTPSESMPKKKTPAKINRGKSIDLLLSNVALLEAAQLKKTLKKSKLETHKLHGSGSGDGVGSQPKVPDKQEDKTTGIDEGTSTKPRVLDVPKYLFESENESWGDSGDDDDDSNEVTNDKTDSDKDESPNLNQNDDKEEENEEEYIRTPNSFDFNDDDEKYEELYKDVNVRHEEPSTQTPPLLNILVTSFCFGKRAFSIETSWLLYQLLEMIKSQILAMVDAQLSTRLEDSIKKSFRSYTTEFEKKAKDERKRYLDLVKKSMKEIIKDEDKNQLPEILPKEVSDCTTPVIQNSITESLENIVLAKSSSQPKSTYEAAASLTEFELKKILLDKIQKSKLYRGAQEHKDLYDALVKSYKLDKDLFESYGKVYPLKRDREDKDKDEDPPAGSDQGLKKQKTSSKSQSKSSGKSTQVEEPVFETADIEMPLNQGEDLDNTDDQPNVEAASKDDWFKKPKTPPTLDSDWNTTNTPIDFSAYVLNNLKIENLTQEYLVGPTFNLLKGTCKSRVELEYHFEECYKAVTDKLDWTNPEGHEYPFDLIKPLPLIEDQGRQVVPANYFINSDLEYLKGGSLSRKYTTFTTKIRVAKYDTIEGIEDMVPSLWSPVKNDVFSRKRIIVVTHVKVMKKYDYRYLEEIVVRREDQQLYKLVEGDFPRLNLRNIKDMLILLVLKKLSNLERDDHFNLNVALPMFTRRVVILKRVEGLQLGVESYQKKFNITRPETFRSDISSITPYTNYKNPQGIIYIDKFQRNRLMRLDELYKFCDGTLSSVRRVLHDIGSSLKMDYLPKRRWSKLDRKRSRIRIKAIDQHLFKRRLMRNLEKFVSGRDYGTDLRLLERTI
ncbi:hypothetical protein Tco_0875059 [Tanacetum coccineum]|uniref:Uncharacterized protein n=1 Tax=Tanacetum coccineum TaxID=301880 RepID=A0ABQ5BS01_9ASTR